MARESNKAKLERIHRESLDEFDRIQKAVQEVRLQCLDDRRFYSIPGAQWEGPVGDSFANKPRFEFNRVHLAVMRIFSEYRANRITVDFQAKDGSPSEMADVCDGLYRADEQASNSDEALDNAFEEAVGGGMGAWRVRASYENDEDEEDERQRCVFEPIFDAESTVFFDLDARRADKRDATRCYVLVPYSREAYKEEFDDTPEAWDREINRTEFDWAPQDVVWVAERYEVVEEKQTVRFFRPAALSDVGEDELKRVTDDDIAADPKLLDELRVTGFRLVKQKQIKRRRVWKVLMSGGKVLEDCGYIAGTEIPIVVAYGKRWVIDGIERCQGHVRLAKDAQRLENMLYSWLAEMAARFDVEKPILTPEQIAGHALMWSKDNIEKFPYLLVNGIEDQNGLKVPPQQLVYTKAPQIPPAMAALAQIAGAALQDMLGNQQAGEEIKPNISGKAVELIQNRLDMQVYIYMSNFSKAVRRSGEIWLAQMRDIVVEQSRAMKTLETDGNAGSVVLNQPAFDAKTGRQYLKNDITRATFDVVAGVGPSSQSLRQAVVRALTGIAAITEDPDTKQALTLATIANIEGEGLADLRDWARAQAIRRGLVKPNEEEKAQLAEEAQGRQPDPQSMLAMQLADQAAADATKKRAETLETLESAQLKAAQTKKTLADAGAANVGSLLSVTQAIRDSVTPPGAVGL